MKYKGMLLKILCLLLAAVFLFGCSSKTLTGQVQSPAPAAASGSDATVRPEETPALPVEERVGALLGQMTLEEKIGQMMQVERNFIRYGDIGAYMLGSVLSGGGSAPQKNDLNNWKQMIKGYQREAAATPHGIPLIYGIDAVHGHNTAEGAVVFPHNIGLGAADDPELMKEIAAVTAEEMLATGIIWNFGPCVAVTQDPRWGRFYEGYGENPDVVTELSSAYISGLDSCGVAASIKHYAADGAARWGTGRDGKIDQGDAALTDAELENIHLKAYKAAVEAGVKTVMVSFSSINGTKCHANREIIQGKLKDEWGFQGFVLSDYNAIHQIPADTLYDQVVIAVNGGIDMMMEADLWQDTYAALEQAAEDGAISAERIDDAVRRILRVKFELGLFENPLGDETLIVNEFASEAHKEVARQAVRESLVLLKNDNDVLPIKDNTKVFVSGPAMDNVGIQCGGWTITWQGVTKMRGGTTILDGFKQAAAQTGGQIITKESNADNADMAVVVIGEIPYAEYEGDDGELSLDGGCALKDNMQALEYAYSLDIPVVVIMVSGRPRIITDQQDKWDAFVQAWLPGSEGAAVADVIYGRYGLTGTLPVTWPKDASALPVADHPGNVLFPYGAGIVTE
jgi:beta-glucosidase